MRQWQWVSRVALALGMMACGAWSASPVAAEIVDYGLRDSQERQIVASIASSGRSAPMTNSSVAAANTSTNDVVLSETPNYLWSYGCAATAAGMIFGYYDRIGYSNMYTGSSHGGVAPLSNLVDLGRVKIREDISLIATKKGLDGRTEAGHVDDYWVMEGQAGPEPWKARGTEHVWGDCVADYMGANQWKWDFNGDYALDANVDGSTTFFRYTNGEKLYDYKPPLICGSYQTAGCHGMRLFAESRGYTVTENYSQLTDTAVTGGFSFADYMTEINNGCPVMIQLKGHSMVGVGYNATNHTVLLHDTWHDDNTAMTMTWGGAYAGLEQWGVTVIHLAALSGGSATAVPEPSTLALLSSGLIGLALARRRRF